jgi:hypothetical protein
MTSPSIIVEGATWSDLLRGYKSTLSFFLFIGWVGVPGCKILLGGRKNGSTPDELM